MRAQPASRYARFETALGACALHWDGDRVVAIRLDPDVAGGTPLASAPTWVREAAGTIARHLDGEPQDLRCIPIATEGLGPFDQAVYEAARALRPGETITYGELAARLGKPGAARAVGQSLGRNPFLVVVPCHRVVASGGRTLGGFSAPGGASTKRAMLVAEGACLAASGAASTLASGAPRSRRTSP